MINCKGNYIIFRNFSIANTKINVILRFLKIDLFALYSSDLLCVGYFHKTYSSLTGKSRLSALLNDVKITPLGNELERLHSQCLVWETESIIGI